MSLRNVNLLAPGLPSSKVWGDLNTSQSGHLGADLRGFWAIHFHSKDMRRMQAEEQTGPEASGCCHQRLARQSHLSAEAQTHEDIVNIKQGCVGDTARFT